MIQFEWLSILIGLNNQPPRSLRGERGAVDFVLYRVRCQMSVARISFDWVMTITILLATMQ